LTESQGWLVVEGTVKEVVAPTTIRVTVSDPSPHVLTVTLIGVRAPTDQQSAKAAISFLRRTTEGREVEIMLNPEDKYFKRQKSRRVDGWVGSVSIAMIGSGVVAYEQPKLYRMSLYDMCRHRLAEDRAKKARVGIWERLSPKP
jgi:hypothetical protein